MYMFQLLMCIQLSNDTHKFSSFSQTRGSLKFLFPVDVKRGTGLSLLIGIFLFYIQSVADHVLVMIRTERGT